MQKSRKTILRRKPGRPGRAEPDGALLLLQAAQSIFDRDGFKTATLRKIAATAGVDPALVVHRFGSKEALWKAVIEQQAVYLAPFVAELKSLQQRTEIPVRARIEIAFQQLVAATFGNPECGMFLARISSERGAKLDLLVEKLLRPYHDAFYPLLVEAAQVGVIKAQRLEMLYFMLIHAVTMTVSYRHVLGYFDDISRNMDHLKEDMTQFLLLNFLEDPSQNGSAPKRTSRLTAPISRSNGMFRHR